MVQRKIYTVDKEELSVLEAGNADDPVIVFLHGIPASAELWRTTILQISKSGYRCLAPDLPGYGQTVIRKEEHYTLSGTATLLTRFFIHNDLENIILVGHDIGGGIAQILATKSEHLFQKLILSNCVTGISWPIPNVEKMIKASKLGLFYWLALFGKFKSDKLYAALSRSFVNTKLATSDFERIFYDGKFHKGRKVKKLQKMLKVLGNAHTAAIMTSLANIRIPVDLIWAMEDKYQPWEKSGQEDRKSVV